VADNYKIKEDWESFKSMVDVLSEDIEKISKFPLSRKLNRALRKRVKDIERVGVRIKKNIIN
jgi:hypothetical protein